MKPLRSGGAVHGRVGASNLGNAGPGEHFTVVGTHALYACDTAAGVRIGQGELATQDVDLLWAARMRVRFLTDLGKQAVRASVLTNAPRFEHVVISATGRMTPRRTIAPGPVIEFKRWMASNAEHRPETKRRRDIRQTDIVQHLVDDRLLLP